MEFAGGVSFRTGDAEEGPVRAAVGSTLQTADMSAKLAAGSRLSAECGESTLPDEVLSAQPGESTLAVMGEVASAGPAAVQLLFMLLMLLTRLPRRSSSLHELLLLLLLMLLMLAAAAALASLALFSSLCMPGMSQRTQSDSAIHASADMASC